MPTRSEPVHVPSLPRPLPAREIAIRLHEVGDAVSRVARAGSTRGPRLLSPADLVRFLMPYTSRN
jgi:hypothetical protein